MLITANFAMSDQSILTLELPLTVKDLNRLDRESGMASTRLLQYYCKTPEEPINQDILETLREDSQRRMDLYLRAMDAVYAVLWADPEW